MPNNFLQQVLKIDYKYSNMIRLAEMPGFFLKIAGFTAHSGDSWFWVAGLIIIWFIGNQDWKELVISMAAGIFITALIVFILKFSIRRKRPSGDWGHIYRKTDPHSFPSGHAARAIMLAVVSMGLGPIWLSGFLTIWAILVTLSRVAMGLHYLSDVIAGGIIGIGTGFLVIIISPYLTSFVS
jgi:undecaprenyl-diphosphatase